MAQFQLSPREGILSCSSSCWGTQPSLLLQGMAPAIFEVRYGNEDKYTETINDDRLTSYSWVQPQHVPMRLTDWILNGLNGLTT